MSARTVYPTEDRAPRLTAAQSVCGPEYAGRLSPAAAVPAGSSNVLSKRGFKVRRRRNSKRRQDKSQGEGRPMIDTLWKNLGIWVDEEPVEGSHVLIKS